MDEDPATERPGATARVRCEYGEADLTLLEIDDGHPAVTDECPVVTAVRPAVGDVQPEAAR